MYYNDGMKKLLLSLICLALIVSLTACKQTKALPKPEIDSGMRGELGIDKNINESTIDQYLNRDDAVYRDMRMLKDTANYEAIGGDSYLSGYVEGFEVVPYPYICNPVGLPEEVGSGYVGVALFTQNEDGTYTSNFKESKEIIHKLFPTDKIIFLMCGGGGYAGMTKKLLVYLGYNPDNIYNVGGYWYYEGEHKVEVKKTKGNETYYDFGLVNYLNIDFGLSNPINGYVPPIQEEENDIPSITSANVIDITSLDGLNGKIENKDTFLLYIYLPGCTSCASFKPIVKEFVESNDIALYEINYQLLKEENNIVKEHIDYTPSIFIFIDGELVSYLDPHSDEDLPIYKTTENLSKWINEYIDVNIVKTKTNNDQEKCGDTSCKL